MSNFILNLFENKKQRVVWVIYLLYVLIVWLDTYTHSKLQNIAIATIATVVISLLFADKKEKTDE